MNNEDTGSSSEQAVATFSDLPLSPEIREAIEAIGYETPSPIQAEAIPYLAEGRDLLGVAQTGTGKTAAFALPLLSNLDTKAGGPQILCLTPTRELAIQVAKAFETFGQRMKNFRALAIYGGDEYRRQIQGLAQGAHVVVGTPGRMMDHLRKGPLE
nr:DEAD/DEAH box helicase [Verrucomicrobiota bacterium]